MQKLVVLIAHASGQLINFNQLACDCGVTIKAVQQYLSILEQTFVLTKVMPFVGNKRTEITASPIYYFIDNGFRNMALGNFSSIESRHDKGLLIQSLIFQELLKWRVQHFFSCSIHYWRTKSSAKVDFVLFRNSEQFVPIEVKFQKLPHPAITRGFHSFLVAYTPPFGVVITKNLLAEQMFEGVPIYFFPLDHLHKLFERLAQCL